MSFSADFDYVVVLDPESGTFFCAANGVLIDTRQLSADQLALLNEGSDDERGELALEFGRSLATELQALEAVSKLLRQPDWSSDTIDAVAETVAATGRDISAPDSW